MNWNQGFKRISAVFWSFWGLVLLGLCGLLIREENYSDAAMMLGVAIALYGAHWVTCWVVDGFFRESK